MIEKELKFTVTYGKHTFTFEQGSKAYIFHTGVYNDIDKKYGIKGLLEYVEHAIKSGVHYLGFNFPKDGCNGCGASGVFDECPVCKSKDITRIRRVSGYLEILDGFTKGKKNEEKNRRAN